MRMPEIDHIAEHPEEPKDSWNRLRGALKDVFGELGGGEEYLRAERNGPQTSTGEPCD